MGWRRPIAGSLDNCIPTRPSSLTRSKTFSVGGVNISAVNIERAVDRFVALIEDGSGGYVTVTSSHGIIEAQSDQSLKQHINDARLAVPDGMPVAWVGRMKIGREVSRVPGAEFFRAALIDPRARHLRHFFYGGNDDSMSALLAVVKGIIGSEAIAGSYCPPLRDAGAFEEETVILSIIESRPSVIWVGLSTPKQEYWMANHTNQFPGTVLVGVGAAFDFLSGRLSRGPRVMHNYGFEWLYRLVQEPKRLWPRYKRVVPKMLTLMCREAISVVRGNS
jgi:N-acetylglucosaminyldiphosphoundecaprenol N-acetyl-beta-D-mannosaminyltransferase